MSNYEINNNSDLVKKMVNSSKEALEQYCAKYPDSLIPQFELELFNLGFHFEIPEQVKQFLPKHKNKILPIAIKYYKLSTYDNEKHFFISLFHYKGFDEVVPILLDDFFSDNTSQLTRQFIGESLRVICSKKYIDDYLKIISSSKYGIARMPFFSLVDALKIDKAIPVLIDLLKSDCEFTTCILKSLSVYKCQELKPYFEQFLNCTDKNIIKIARAGLKKLK